jgi:glycosyltransferase involved in cell wall biosynthesis
VTVGTENFFSQAPYPYDVRRTPVPYLKLHCLHLALKKMIAQWSPDVVIHFPFGTFHGLRGVANKWSIKHVDQFCCSAGVRCLTVFYSITDCSRETIKRLVREPVLNPADGWVGWCMSMGTDLADLPKTVSQHRAEPTVLFMAGLQETRRKTLQHVLEERGLADIVKAAPELGKAKVRILVAVPLLRDRRLAEELRQMFVNAFPEIRLEVRSQISVPGIFEETDLYLFPYRRELTQFIPTSVIEAMAVGVPVVISDLEMFSPLTRKGETAYVYRAGDSDHLEKTILSALADPAGRLRKADRARVHVLKNWSMERTVSDLVNILEGKA